MKEKKENNMDSLSKKVNDDLKKVLKADVKTEEPPLVPSKSPKQSFLKKVNDELKDSLEETQPLLPFNTDDDGPIVIPGLNLENPHEKQKGITMADIYSMISILYIVGFIIDKTTGMIDVSWWWIIPAIPGIPGLLTAIITTNDSYTDSTYSVVFFMMASGVILGLIISCNGLSWWWMLLLLLVLNKMPRCQ